MLKNLVSKPTNEQVKKRRVKRKRKKPRQQWAKYLKQNKYCLRLAIAGLIVGLVFGGVSVVGLYQSTQSGRFMKKMGKKIEALHFQICDENPRYTPPGFENDLLASNDTALLFVYSFGQEAFQEKNFDKAERYFRAAKECTCDSTDIITILFMVALTQNKQGKLKESDQTWEEIMKISEAKKASGAMSAALRNYRALGEGSKVLEYTLRLSALEGQISHPLQSDGLDIIEFQKVYKHWVEEQQLVLLSPEFLPALGGDLSELPAQYQEYFDSAQKAFTNQEFEKAARYYKLAANYDMKYGSGIMGVFNLNFAGESFLRGRMFRKARNSFDNMYLVAVNLHWKEAQAYALNYAGLSCWEYGDTLNALDYYQRSLKILKDIKSQGREYTRSRAILYNKIGVIYQVLGDFQKAQVFYKQAYESNTDIQAEVDLNIGVRCIEEGNFQEALFYLNKSLTHLRGGDLKSYCNFMILYALQKIKDAEMKL
ncbi:hypothetical protein JXM67_05355 [candidate division WOR-3 bacterium]|nr:hypothetical protein [candidate division WOR-3 bacterium]